MAEEKAQRFDPPNVQRSRIAPRDDDDLDLAIALSLSMSEAKADKSFHTQGPLRRHEVGDIADLELAMQQSKLEAARRRTEEDRVQQAEKDNESKCAYVFMMPYAARAATGLVSNDYPEGVIGLIAAYVGRADDPWLTEMMNGNWHPSTEVARSQDRLVTNSHVAYSKGARFSHLVSWTTLTARGEEMWFLTATVCNRKEETFVYVELEHRYHGTGSVFNTTTCTVERETLRDRHVLSWRGHHLRLEHHYAEGYGDMCATMTMPRSAHDTFALCHSPSSFMDKFEESVKWPSMSCDRETRPRNRPRLEKMPSQECLQMPLLALVLFRL